VLVSGGLEGEVVVECVLGDHIRLPRATDREIDEANAARATPNHRVARSTIYRHWQSRDEVLLSVIEACAPALPEPDPAADVVTSIRETLRSIARSLNDPEWARLLPALLMLRYHEAGIAAIEQRLEREQDKVLTTLLRRAVEEGVVPDGVDVQESIAMLVGSLLFAHLTEAVPLDEGFADRPLDRFLAAHRA
jgi:AcrR family transcriptional regulator